MPDPVQFVDQSGQFTDDFRTSLPTLVGDELWKGPDGQPFKGLDDIKDLPSMAKTFVSQSRKIGQKVEGMIRIPGADAKPEEIAAYRKAIGVPDKADAYAYDPPKPPAGVQIDEKELEALQDKGFYDAMRGIAHKVGMPAEMFKAVVGEYDQLAMASYAKARDAAKQAEDDAWKTGWQEISKEQGSGLTENLRLGVQALRAFGGPEAAQLAEKLRIHDTPDKADLWRIISRSPADVSMLIRIGQKMKTGLAMPNQGIQDQTTEGSIYSKEFHEAVTPAA